jgi:hypothetical protein
LWILCGIFTDVRRRSCKSRDFLSLKAFYWLGVIRLWLHHDCCSTSSAFNVCETLSIALH